MKNYSFLLSVVKKLESLRPGVFVYAYKEYNSTGEHWWWFVSVSDIDLYRDTRFKMITKAFSKAAKVRGFGLVFVCNWIPKEKTLVELAEKDCLILNV